MTKGQWEVSSWLLFGWLLVVAGTVLPDIDHPESFIGKRLKFVSHPLSALLGHRGFTHSLLIVGLLLWVTWRYDWWWMFWLTFGYAGHLLGDYLTDSGIPALWPSRKRYQFILVGTTGGLSEYVLVGLMIALAGYIVWL